MTEDDLPMLKEWLNRPHVSAWWGSCETVEETRAEYLPLLAENSTATPYIACLDGLPIGYIQSYVAAGAGDGWWPDEHDPGVRGIDQFLADEERLGQGLGTEMVRQFTLFLFEDPAVTSIQADPSPDNEPAIRCYEKAGFREVGMIDTPDGAALLMVMAHP